MPKANIYLNFPGNTEEVFNFYKSVFGGEFTMLSRFGETPDGAKMPLENRDKVMHVGLPIAPDHVLMGSDTLEGMGPAYKMGNNFSISLNTDSQEESDQLFAGLSAGGQTDMPMQNTFWGAYFGMLTDQFGIQWLVSYDENYQ